MFKKLFKSRRNKLSEFTNGTENKFLITDKAGISYGVAYIPYETDDKVEYGGIYKVFNKRGNEIGSLSFVNHYDDVPPFALLCDIYFEPNVRNLGIGSKLISVFEEKAKLLGAERIEGELSSVDETGDNVALRNNFYINRGYEIVDKIKIVKHL